MARRNPADQGFTLLELLMVTIIVALVLAVSYPALSKGSAALHLRSAGRDVLNVFRYAREKAVSEQRGMKVTVDRQKQELVLSDDFGDNSRRYAPPGSVKIQRVDLGDAEVTDGPALIRFLPNGSSDRAKVVLKSETGSTLRIITDPITGGARIEQGPGGD